jgi:hypothetical protein
VISSTTLDHLQRDLGQTTKPAEEERGVVERLGQQPRTTRRARTQPASGPVPVSRQASLAQRKPTLPEDDSAVFDERAATR